MICSCNSIFIQNLSIISFTSLFREFYHHYLSVCLRLQCSTHNLIHLLFHISFYSNLVFFYLYTKYVYVFKLYFSFFIYCHFYFSFFFLIIVRYYDPLSISLILYFKIYPPFLFFHFTKILSAFYSNSLFS